MRPGVASQAPCVDILGRRFSGIKDLGDIAAAGYMLAARAVAVFTRSAIRVAVHLGHFGVRIGGESLADFRVA